MHIKRPLGLLKSRKEQLVNAQYGRIVPVPPIGITGVYLHIAAAPHVAEGACEGARVGAKVGLTPSPAICLVNVSPCNNNMNTAAGTGTDIRICREFVLHRYFFLLRRKNA